MTEKKLEEIVSLTDLIIYIHSCKDTHTLIDKYNDFSLRYKKQEKAIQEMVKYLKDE